MEYELSDSSGTDDDLHPSHPNRFTSAGRASGSGRSAVVGTTTTFPRMHGDMETKIHLIEQEAYRSVLRAFKAQSDAITWEKESLITELRKELRVSDEEHRELLSRVNSDDIIRQIREWRKGNGGIQHGMVNSNQQPVCDQIPSPTTTTLSAARKKQKTSHSLLGPPSPAIRPSMQQQQPSSSALKRGHVSAGRGGKKPKSYGSSAGGFTGRLPQLLPNQQQQGPHPRAFAAVNEPSSAAEANFDSFIGRKVWTRWPADNSFYEAVITDYKPLEGLHALVYDINTADETWEWVNLKEISPEDIRWDGEDPGISRRGARSGSGPGRGSKKSMDRGGVAGGGRGRGRGAVTKGGHHSKKDFNTLQQNGIGKKAPLSDIEILHTDTLVREVERVFGSSHPDPIEVEKAKKVLKEHEQALIDAIARLENASDGESDRGEGRFSSQGQSINDEERGEGWRKRRHYDEMGEEEEEARRRLFLGGGGGGDVNKKLSRIGSGQQVDEGDGML